MGLAVKSSFSAGELDPALHERTTLEKYNTGLAKARNVVVSKTGSIISRPGRKHFFTTKNRDEAVRLYSPPGSTVLLEWGPYYVRFWDTTLEYPLGYLGEASHSYTEAQLDIMQFHTSGTYVYVFVDGAAMSKLDYDAMTFGSSFFDIPNAPISCYAAATSGAPATSGYQVQYLATYVKDGEESEISAEAILYSGSPLLLPIATGEWNRIAVQADVAGTEGITEIKIYRRPASSTTGYGAWGYIGSSSHIYSSGGYMVGQFTDWGGDADYTHNPPSTVTLRQANPLTFLSNTGLVYQQRLILADAVTDREALYASRPGFQNNFWRDYPLNDDSSLKFKCGTSGYAEILHLLDSDGLVAFTTNGIFINQGQLGVANIAMAKKGKWISDLYAPPLAVPGGTLFVDAATGTVRNLTWGDTGNTGNLMAPEVSIYSNHLFLGRDITTWGFQEGSVPLLWTVFDDGEGAAFTFEFDQQMRAWTRVDGTLPIRSCAPTVTPDRTYFVVAKTHDDGTVERQVEYTVPRYITNESLVDDPEIGMKDVCGFMDGMVVYENLFNDSLAGSDTFTFSPVLADTWDGELILNCGTSGVFSLLWVALWSDKPIRFFDDRGTAIDLNYVSRTDSNNIVVEMADGTEFPYSEYATGARLYATHSSVDTYFDHLEGETISVIVDGAVVASPYNDQESYSEITVDSGTVTLPDGMYGAIILIGRPIVADIETLDIDTVEQKPTMVESMTVNKVLVKTLDTQGLYVGNRLPSGNGLSGMVSLSQWDVDYESSLPVIGNRVQPKYTKRREIILPGDWKSQGRICFRQVDPLHFEILSVIPDVEVLYRSDR
jgi:hypothetical protein